MFPRWYRALWGVTLTLFVFVLVAYHLGSGGIRFAGASQSFDRSGDAALFRIDGTRAYEISRSSVSIVTYRRDLLFFACGCWVADRRIANGVRYQNGDWAYTDHPELPRPEWHQAVARADAVNLATGETLDLDVPDPPHGMVNPMAIPAYAQRGLTFDPRFALTPERVAQEHEALFMQRESCVELTLAFYLVFAALAVLGAVLYALRRISEAPLT